MLSTQGIVSGLLVLTQFALVAALFFLPADWTWSALALTLVGAGGALGIWTLATNRIGNFNIRPEPKRGAVLVTAGPYRFIRHPMYLALALVCLGLVIASNQTGRFLLWLALVGVLVVKANVEERWLMRTHGRYKDYRKSTKRFIPFVW